MSDHPKRDAIVAAFAKFKSEARTARELGLSRSTVRTSLREAMKRGEAPGLIKTEPVPGASIVKTTVQYGADGKPVNEWRRLVPDAQDMEEWVQGLEERAGEAGAKVKLPKPAAGDKDLMLEVTVGDHHMGMLAWAKESGAAYDCAIAAQLLVDGVARVLADTPPVQKVLLVTMGDYYHSDNRTGTTEKSGHMLDIDSRYPRRVDAGIDALVRCVELAAAKAQEVEVLIINGNHDWHSAVWLARVLSAYFRGQKRINVRTDPTPRKYVQHGKVLLGYTHGDTTAARDLPQLMAQEQPQLWAATVWRRWREGHWHTRKRLTAQTVSERPGVVVETLPTLCAPDSYASDHGYQSGRAIAAFLWSAKWGLRAHLERSADELIEEARKRA